MTETTTNIDKKVVRDNMQNIKNLPKEILFNWFQARETYESGINFQQQLVEKQKIRDERMKVFLPKMKEEFENFSQKLIKRQKFRKINNNVLFKIIKPIIPYVFTGLFFILFYLGTYKFGLLFNIVKSVLSIIPIGGGVLGFLLGVCSEMVLFIYSFILPFRFADSLLYTLITKDALFAQKSDLLYYDSDEYIIKDSPYIEAFLLGNCICRKSNVAISEITGNNRYKFMKAKNVFIPSEIINMNFEEFINFIEDIFEPQNDNFENGEVFEAIFFYPNKKRINKNRELRTKIKQDLDSEIKNKSNLGVARNYVRTTKVRSGYQDNTYIKVNYNNLQNKINVNNYRNRSNTSLITQINMINSNDIRNTAMILTGQENYAACEEVFGLMGNSSNWLWFTKSVMESNEFYLNKISNNDLRQCAKAIITGNYNSVSMINNDDIRNFTKIVIEKQELATGYINNKDLMILARVLTEYRAF